MLIFTQFIQKEGLFEPSFTSLYKKLIKKKELKMFEKSVWERYGSGNLSKNLYVFFIAVWTTLGIVASAIAAYYTQTWELTWVFFIGVLLVGILGVVIALWSKNPLISLFGYMLVAIPFGMMLGPVVALYTIASVFNILIVTASVVVVFGFVGAILPDSLENWRGWLFGALVMLLIGYFVVPFASFFGLPVDRALSWLDWIGVVVFCFYVIYDINRALRIPYTLDNSVDVALSIYLDFINIFIRLLSRRGRKKN